MSKNWSKTLSLLDKVIFPWISRTYAIGKAWKSDEVPSPWDIFDIFNSMPLGRVIDGNLHYSMLRKIRYVRRWAQREVNSDTRDTPSRRHIIITRLLDRLEQDIRKHMGI